VVVVVQADIVLLFALELVASPQEEPNSGPQQNHDNDDYCSNSSSITTRGIAPDNRLVRASRWGSHNFFAQAALFPVAHLAHFILFRCVLVTHSRRARLGHWKRFGTLSCFGHATLITSARASLALVGFFPVRAGRAIHREVRRGACKNLVLTALGSIALNTANPSNVRGLSSNLPTRALSREAAQACSVGAALVQIAVPTLHCTVHREVAAHWLLQDLTRIFRTAVDRGASVLRRAPGGQTNSARLFDAALSFEAFCALCGRWSPCFL